MAEAADLLMPTEQRGSSSFSLSSIFFKDIGHAFSRDELGVEIMQIALPAVMALAADPIASLVDTAFIGQIGAVELAAAGVAIAVFNQLSRITIFPLVSITTSFVAEEDAGRKFNCQDLYNEDIEKANHINPQKQELLCLNDADNVSSPESDSSNHDDVRQIGHRKKHIPSVSSALVIGGVLGLLQTVILIFGAKPLLHFMGVKYGSPMLKPAYQYLTMRALGAPAVLLSLAMQGVFRGLKDTKTPLYATVAGDATNIVLDPILMFALHLGISGAAIAHVISQYSISLILLWRLTREVDVLPPNIRDVQFSRFLRNGFWLLGRVIAVTFCVTLAASMAARLGSVPMAAFQICLQIWLATSLLADGLAIARQTLLARAFAQKDHYKATVSAVRVLQLAVALGLSLALLLGLGLQFTSRLFTNDPSVLQLISTGIPFVALTQPVNALAFVFDGINFGASDFKYSACSMGMVAIVSIICLVILSAAHGFVGIWIALTVYMSLRMFAGFWRIGVRRGPWAFLRN